MQPITLFVYRINHCLNIAANSQVRENLDEFFIILPVYGRKLYKSNSQMLQSLCTDNIGRLITAICQNLRLLGWHNGRKLQEISDQNDLHSSERELISPVDLKRNVDGIEKVSSDHRHLVDDDALKVSEKLRTTRDWEDIFWTDDVWWEPEKRVNCLSFHIQRRNASRR
jgi:hypothetical protein